MSPTPDPPSAPGGLPLLGQTIPFLRDPLGTLERLGQRGDDLLEATIAGQQFCLVTSPELTEQVLATDADTYRKADIVRENLGTLQGGSLVLLEGEAWRDRRRLLQGSFEREQVRTAAATTTEYATTAVDGWPSAVRVDERMRSLSLAILARSLLGIGAADGETPIHAAADDILARMDPGSLSAFLPEWVPTPTNYRFRSAVATLHDEIEAVVAETDPADEPRSLLSVLNAADLDREQVRDELIALLFAGYDSTATALAMTLALVADHPDVQGRLRAELAETVGQRPPTAADLEDLPVLDRVVRESLRLYPPQYVLLREPRADTALGEYRITEGTTVVCSPWVHHRDARFWAAPTEFRPQRWRSDDDRPEFAYLPYGGGPRYCLGRGLAAQTIRLVVAVVCGRRRLELDGEIVVDAGPTLSPGPLELQTERDPL